MWGGAGMPSPRDYREPPPPVDYAGPPPDPPPTGPELASPPDYGSPPRSRPASRTEEDYATAPEQRDSPDGGAASTSEPTDITSQEEGMTTSQEIVTLTEEGGEASQEGGEASLEGGEASQEGGEGDPPRPVSAASSGAVPLLREDASGVFRRMATREEWEERQTLIDNSQSPPGSGEAAMAMGHSLLRWKRLLGLAVPPMCPDEYFMPPVMPSERIHPPTFCKVLTSIWVVVIVVAVFASVGLQWAYCEREYYGRMQVWPGATSNSTAHEYLCVHSFVWTFLVPRLLFVFGYLAVFACVFCLSAPDLEYVVTRAYDMITEDRQNAYTTRSYIEYCRRDPRVLAFWFLAIHGLSLVGSLLGEGIVQWDGSTKPKPPHPSVLEWATYITTCFVRLMMDSMIGHCLVHYSLAVKYLELMVFRATWYLQSLVTLRSNLSACQYFFTRMQTVDGCMAGAQAGMSAAVLMAVLRICQVAALVCVDQTNEPVRRTSLAQLPIAVLFLLMLMHHIRRCISLTETWHEVFEKEPKIHIHPQEPPGPDPLNIVHPFTEEQELNRATVLWHQILRDSPQVHGRVMGLAAGHWMYWAVLVVGVVYCGGYYALLKHAPLI